MAQLRVTSAALKGQSFALEGEYYTIGREADNSICLAHQSISKHHAMLTVDKGDFKLWDLHSTNGIVVNGQKTVLRHLKDGDRVTLGDVEFVFSSNGSPPPAPPQAETQRIVLTPPASKPAPVAKPLLSPSATAQTFAEPKPLPVTQPPTTTQPQSPVSKVELKSVPPVDAQPPKISASKAETKEIFIPPEQPEAPKIRVSMESPLRQPEPKPVTMPMAIALTPVAPASQPTPKIELPQPPPPIPVVEPKSAPPVNSPPSKALDSKAETKEIIIRPLPSDAPKIKVSMEQHPPPATAPVLPTPPEPKKESSTGPVEIKKIEPAANPPSIAESQPSPIATVPVRKSKSITPTGRRLIYLTMFLGGLAVLVAGYGLNITGCKFIGFILSITGFICLTFAVRFNGIVAPPR